MTASIYLTDLTSNDTAEIIAIAGDKDARKRLSDLGLIPGTSIIVLRKAPYSGPIKIKFRGATLVIGYSLAKKIKVNKNL